MGSLSYGLSPRTAAQGNASRQHNLPQVKTNSFLGTET